MQDQIDVESFDVMEFLVDGFCNYQCKQFVVFVEELLIDRVQLLGLSVFEMIVLVGGLCVLDVNYDQFVYGILIDWFGVLMNDFFVNLLWIDMVWKVQLDVLDLFDGLDCKIGVLCYIVLCVDLVFGLNLQLCVIVEVYVQDDVQVKFVKDFVVVWFKVMNVDCFDVC